jgi:hypothetical protein
MNTDNVDNVDMKICVCSLYINDWYREITKYGKLSVENYCVKHGYDFVHATEDWDGYDGERDPPWYKIRMLLEVLETGKYDIVVWNDADTQIVDDSISLESKIDKFMEGKDMLLAREHGAMLNTGTMFMRNTEWSKEILCKVWDNVNPEFDFHEQSSLLDLYMKNVDDAQTRIRVLESTHQNEFLSYWSMYYPKTCFIMHCTRCSQDRVGFIFTMDMFCRVKMEEENDQEYEKRIEWLDTTDICRADIDHYHNGGARRNVSVRYEKYLRDGCL